MNKCFLYAFAFFCLICAGCAENISPNTYTTNEVGAINHVIEATIVSMRPVKINNSSGAGGLAGTVAGGAAGSTLGGSPEANVVGAVGGAVIGGVVGESIDKNIHKKHGIEYILRKKNGSLISVVQTNEIDFKIGQQVLIIYGNKTRMIPNPNHKI